MAAAADVMRAGGVVAFPTDTLYGLAVDPRRGDAVERLFALKGRRADAAVPLIAGDVEQAAAAGEFGAAEMRLAAAFWPGPLSLVVPARDPVARAVLAADGTVAIRVPAHAVARALALTFGFCITATSANPSGRPPAESADAVADTVTGVDLLLDCGAAPGGLPSTIVSLQGGVPVLVRAGAIGWDRVVKSLQ
jgi:L-threonylcarbamoyladenylate synthase